MTVVLKLGGSVITEKGREATVDESALEHAAATIAEADIDRLVVVHGGGSFGHPAAATHGVSQTDGSHDADAVRAIHGTMCELNETVVGRLAAVEVPAVPVHPLSAAARAESGDLRLAVESVRTLLEEGFVPVLHGDVVAHAGAGVTVLSGDEIVTDLARSLRADRVGLCSTVPGVLDGVGTVIEHIDSFETVAPDVGSSDETDVTGGMAGKVQALLGLDVSAQVFGLDDLGAFLAGGEPGTRVG